MEVPDHLVHAWEIDDVITSKLGVTELGPHQMINMGMGVGVEGKTPL